MPRNLILLRAPEALVLSLFPSLPLPAYLTMKTGKQMRCHFPQLFQIEHSGTQFGFNFVFKADAG